MYLALTLLLLLAGALVLTLGLRGRRVDDHPLCRGCGFDLEGVYPQRNICPECGRELDAAKDVRIGHRRANRSAVALGSALTLFALAGAGAWIWGAATGFNWNTIKPTPLLVIETRGGDADRVDAALEELTSRLEGGRLAQRRIDELAGRALAVQADDEQRWSTRWGDFVESAIVGGHLTDRQTQRYFAQGVRVSLSARRRVEHGDTFPCHVVVRTDRLGNARTFAVRIESGQHLTIAGPDGSVRSLRTGGGMTMIGAQSIGMFGTSHEIDLPPGEYRATARVEFQILDGFGSGAPVLATIEVQRVTGFEVVPSGEAAIATRSNPEFDERVREAVEVRQLEITSFRDAPQLQGFVYTDSPPLPLAFDVYARDGEREWMVGNFTSSAPGRAGRNFMGPAEGFDGDTVTIILRSSTEAAKTDVSITEIWEGELIFEDLPVTRRGR